MSTPVWQSGFRPLFLSASTFALLAVSLWLATLWQPALFTSTSMPSVLWHAHEMIYGYTLAVIAGFLLTAVHNWTQLETASSGLLRLLCCSWLIARFAWLVGEDYLLLAALADMVFALSLSYAIARPVVATRQWRQAAIISKVLLLGTGNALFYLSALGYLDVGTHWTLHGAVYLIIALVLTISRRVVPFFISRGTNQGAKLFNARWIDLSCMIGFVVFFILDLVSGSTVWSQLIAAGLSLLLIRRVIGWYVSGIWQSPLLWSLLASLLLIALGFMLYALQDLLRMSPGLPLHAFALGGIGTLTLSMMARVSLGHTGRDTKSPPQILHLALALLVLATLLRSVLPALLPAYYMPLVQLAGFFWLVAFAIFLFVFTPILVRPRIDGGVG